MKRILMHNTVLVSLVAVAAIWAIIFWRGITTAYSVWLTSEIYNHCLLILPVVIYLIYEKWPQLKSATISPNYLLLVPILGVTFIQLFAEIGDIKILMHIATFVALPLMAWLVLGDRATKIIAFPLFFTLFAIPIGDQLIPTLQEITTDIAVPLLNWTNVPVYRNGLYLDIPEGRFLVAEACSGISFLITTIAFGFLYAYLFFTQRKRQLIYVVAAFVLPIMANAIRVYGIILTGHLTNMEHAVGADHLIYGGVFFGLVLFLLIVFGELIKEPKKSSEPNTHQEAQEKEGNKCHSFHSQVLLTIVVICIVKLTWASNTQTPSLLTVKTLPIENTMLNSLSNSKTEKNWMPNYDTNLVHTAGTLTLTDEKTTALKTHESHSVSFFIAFYDGANGKLISSVHRDFDQKRESLVSSNTFDTKHGTVHYRKLTSTNGEPSGLFKWYKINGKHFYSESKAKLYQAWLKLWGDSSSGAVYIIKFNRGIEESIVENLEKIEHTLNSSLL